MTTRFSQFKLVGPVLVLVAILIAGLAAVPYYGVKRLDAESRERQETLVKRNISIWIADVEFALTAWTIWDESIAKIDNSFDREWADRNIGSSLIGTSRTRFAAILDAEDSMIYAKTADEVVGRPFFVRRASAIVDDAGSLVRRVREREAGVKKPGIPDPIAFSKIEVIGSDAVLLTASLFQADFQTAKPRGNRAPILVSAIPIAGSLQDFLGNRFLLDDATIGPLSSVSPDRARAEIAVGQDGQVEVLSWHPPTPASDLLLQSLPLAAAVTILLIVGGLFVMRLSRRTVVSLVEAEQRMRHAATHDFLTGLANRSMIEPEFARLSSCGSLTVACLDLDGFKSVNDRHGHAAGDELLRQVAQRLKAGTRDGDAVFRLGGDEFAVLMPSVPMAEAEWRCRQLSQLLSQPYVIDDVEAQVGASFGLGEVQVGGGETCDQALKRADAALYAAKAKGRGIVVTSAMSSEGSSSSAVHPNLAKSRK
ncbi:diguanylate cyclase (plasmid) [Rhizobium grahamii]|uniref:diguanylate cyclase n=1 Tax=Rhizobium grahamii TaxID=1120045 RepID=A0A5Q0CGD7_9HYPH|nr:MULTISPECIES: diguanylate cyclase [Rhizobium]QFY63250.1 diguanylate cyclase [Rhizobium grahamii]QRM51986.1 diguanylate cyclase [Rhizobium sp. BG6]